MKFSIIPINRKYDDNDNIIIRRILISYQDKKDAVYQNVSIIDKDDYFKDENSSHQYIFTPEGFKLIKTTQNSGDEILLDWLRSYRCYQDLFPNSGIECIEFECDSEKEAIEIFKRK